MLWASRKDISQGQLRGRRRCAHRYRHCRCRCHCHHHRRHHRHRHRYYDRSLGRLAVRCGRRTIHFASPLATLFLPLFEPERCFVWLPFPTLSVVDGLLDTQREMFFTGDVLLRSSCPHVETFGVLLRARRRRRFFGPFGEAFDGLLRPYGSPLRRRTEGLRGGEPTVLWGLREVFVEVFWRPLGIRGTFRELRESMVFLEGLPWRSFS